MQISGDFGTRWMIARTDGGGCVAESQMGEFGRFPAITTLLQSTPVESPMSGTVPNDELAEDIARSAVAETVAAGMAAVDGGHPCVRPSGVRQRVSGSSAIGVHPAWAKIRSGLGPRSGGSILATGHPFRSSPWASLVLVGE